MSSWTIEQISEWVLPILGLLVLAWSCRGWLSLFGAPVSESADADLATLIETSGLGEWARQKGLVLAAKTKVVGEDGGRVTSICHGTVTFVGTNDLPIIVSSRDENNMKAFGGKSAALLAGQHPSSPRSPVVAAAKPELLGALESNEQLRKTVAMLDRTCRSFAFSGSKLSFVIPMAPTDVDSTHALLTPIVQAASVIRDEILRLEEVAGSRTAVRGAGIP